MKVSIITASYNSEKTISATLNSIKNQDYKNIEHIIVDGGSYDNTINILRNYNFKNKKIIIGKDKNLYEAINKGIKKATGDIIAILNSDDIYQNESVISNIVKKIKKNKKIDIFLSDVVFFSGNAYNKITRYYKAFNFTPRMFRYGLMPPHPGTFIRKKTYANFGLYNDNYNIASDFDLLSRFIYINKINFKYINLISVRMRTGGISGENLKAYLISSIEIIKSLNKNKIKSNIFNVLMRIPSKLNQFFYFWNARLNKDFRLKIHDDYLLDFKNRFRVIKSLKSINFNDNFVLSALNLAFLGYFSANKIENFKSLTNWPDGLFSKIYGYSLKKIPGREIVRKLKLPKKIKEIIVVGNITKKSTEFLEKKFKKPVKHYPVPYGDVEILKKNIFLKTNKNQLIFITLPTPKQEIIAQRVASKNKYFQIICIGASINIASGEEKEVPKMIKNLEFLWRLRYETIRRTIRLIETFIYFINGRFINKNIKDISVDRI